MSISEIANLNLLYLYYSMIFLTIFTIVSQVSCLQEPLIPGRYDHGAGPAPPRNPDIVNPTRAPYQDPAQPTWLRVEDLLSRMPIREKMAQLMQGTLSDTYFK
jgi:hypothetical protein